MPMSLAIARTVQWVASPGGGCSGAGNHPFDQLGRQPWDARRPGLVAQQPVDAGLQVARLPAPHAGLGLARPAHDLDRAQPVGREQHDLCPPDVFLRTVPIGHERRQTRTIGGRKPKAAGFSHAGTLPQANAKRDSYVRDDPLDPSSGRLRLFWAKSKCYQSVSQALMEAARSVAANLSHDKMAHELFLIEQHADLSDFPPELRETILDFLDPYSESSNLRIDTSVMLIAFDFNLFATIQALNPNEVETYFEQQLATELPKFTARLDIELSKHAVPPHDLHVFFLPLKSVVEMRERFQARIGWNS